MWTLSPGPRPHPTGPIQQGVWGRSTAHQALAWCGPGHGSSPDCSDFRGTSHTSQDLLWPSMATHSGGDSGTTRFSPDVLCGTCVAFSSSHFPLPTLSQLPFPASPFPASFLPYFPPSLPLSSSFPSPFSPFHPLSSVPLPLPLSFLPPFLLFFFSLSFLSITFISP